MKRFLAAVAVVVLAFGPALSIATEYKDGSTPANGVPPFAQPVQGWDGAHNVNWRVDPNGIGRVTEEYPITSQRVSYTAATAVTVHAGLKAIGNGYAIGPYGYRAIHIERTAGTAGAGNTKLYIFSSDDNVTYKPLIVPFSATVSGADFFGAYQDTAKMDTMQINLPNIPLALNAWYTLPNNFHMGRYVQFWASRTDSANANVTTALSLTWELREQ